MLRIACATYNLSSKWLKSDVIWQHKAGLVRHKQTTIFGRNSTKNCLPLADCQCILWHFNKSNQQLWGVLSEQNTAVDLGGSHDRHIHLTAHSRSVQLMFKTIEPFKSFKIIIRTKKIVIVDKTSHSPKNKNNGVIYQVTLHSQKGLAPKITVYSWWNRSVVPGNAQHSLC